MIMAITEPMIPMIVVPLAFLFVLLIILISKAPKAGAWVIGGLILLAPIFFYRLAMGGAFAHEEAIPLFVVPASFLFVLLMIVLAKVPKAGAGLVVALVVMALVGLVVAIPVSHRREAKSSSVVRIRQSGDAGTGLSIIRDDLETVHLEVSKTSSGLKQLVPPPPPVLPAPAPAPSPIWSEGIEREFNADVYPSKAAAIRVLGSKLEGPIRERMPDLVSDPQIVLFQQEHDRGLIVELKNALERVQPDVDYVIEAQLRNIQPNEMGVTLRLTDIGSEPAAWAQSPEVKVASGRIEVNLFGADSPVTLQERFVEKPWLDDFATFANTRPEQQFIVARSLGTCTSEGEANQQALDDARARLSEALGTRTEWRFGRLPEPTITTTDVLEGRFLVDRFAQSFEGAAGRIWRQALLIDVSGPKLVQLAKQKAYEARSTRMSWARMGLSVVGVLVLIGAIYFFLNMATMGYYEWSLRVAGIVLAIMAIISILMIVQ